MALVRWGRTAHPPFLWAGAVTGFLPTGLSFGTTKICRDGGLVPFAITSRLYVRLSHANVQRGLAAAPFAIPAPGRKSPLRGSRAFFPPATGRARQYVPVLSCPRTAYSAHPWASPLRGQRFELFKNAPGIFVHPVRPGLRRNGAADFFKPEQNPPH